MKIKIVSNNKKELTMWRLLLRSFILYNIWIYIVGLVLAYTMNIKTYYIAYSLLNNAGSIIQIIIVMMVIMNKDNRGLHDYLVNTKIEFIDNGIKEEVIDAEIVEEG